MIRDGIMRGDYKLLIFKIQSGKVNLQQH